ncbi:MAG: hypothetical protein ACFFED_12895 [Candidatus Thorarchaeota archaeon]
MASSMYELVMSWTKGEWNGGVYFQIINQVSKTLSSIGHGDTPLGDAMYDLWEWFGEVTGPAGYGLRRQELVKELSNIMGRTSSKVFESVEIEIQESPELKVNILNIDELKTTADPEHEAKAKKRFDEMFSAFVDKE